MENTLTQHPWLSVVGALAILAVVAWAASEATERLLLVSVQEVAKRTRSTWDDRLLERKVFERIAHHRPGDGGLLRHRARARHHA